MLRPENNQIIYLTEREGWTGCEAPLHGVVHCDAAQSFSSARERWWFVVVSRCGTTQVHVVIAASSHRYTRVVIAARSATEVYTRHHCRPWHQTGHVIIAAAPHRYIRVVIAAHGTRQVHVIIAASSHRYTRVGRRHTGTRVVIAAAHSNGATCYWHCPHSMRSRVYATVGHPSVRPAIHLSVMSVCPSVLLGCRCCGFAAVVAAATRYRSIAVRQARPAGASQRSAAAGPQHGAQQQTWGVPRCQLA